MGLMPLQNTQEVSSPFPSFKTQGEVSSYYRVLGQNSTMLTLILDFQAQDQ